MPWLHYLISDIRLSILIAFELLPCNVEEEECDRERSPFAGRRIGVFGHQTGSHHKKRHIRDETDHFARSVSISFSCANFSLHRSFRRPNLSEIAAPTKFASIAQVLYPALSS